MRDLFLRFCRWALPLLGISGAISCDNVIQTYDMYGCPPAEYGVPTMEFRMKGKVVDSGSGQPIKGIAVTRINEDTSFESTDTVWTAENGEFIFQGADFPSESMILKFTDMDGADNLGRFLNKEIKVKLTKEEGSEDGWFAGTYKSDDILVGLDSDFNTLSQPMTNLEFWIGQNVDDVDFSKYQEKYGLMGGREFYGTGYTPTLDEWGQQVDPEHCVIYTVTSYPDYSDEAQHVTCIYITDPSIEFYDITLKSTFEEFVDLITQQGFIISLENEYSIHAEKGKFSVSLTKEWIRIRVEVLNDKGVEFSAKRTKAQDYRANE